MVGPGTLTGSSSSPWDKSWLYGAGLKCISAFSLELAYYYNLLLDELAWL